MVMGCATRLRHGMVSIEMTGDDPCHNGSVDTEWKDYISKIVEMRAPAMSVWSEMKELGFSKVGDYLHHLKRFGLEDKQWEALVNRYGLTNAK